MAQQLIQTIKDSFLYPRWKKEFFQLKTILYFLLADIALYWIVFAFETTDHDGSWAIFSFFLLIGGLSLCAYQFTIEYETGMEYTIRLLPETLSALWTRKIIVITCYTLLWITFYILFGLFFSRQFYLEDPQLSKGILNLLYHYMMPAITTICIIPLLAILTHSVVLSVTLSCFFYLFFFSVILPSIEAIFKELYFRMENIPQHSILFLGILSLFLSHWMFTSPISQRNFFQWKISFGSYSLQTLLSKIPPLGPLAQYHTIQLIRKELLLQRVSITLFFLFIAFTLLVRFLSPTPTFLHRFYGEFMMFYVWFNIILLISIGTCAGAAERASSINIDQLLIPVPLYKQYLIKWATAAIFSLFTTLTLVFLTTAGSISPSGFFEWFSDVFFNELSPLLFSITVILLIVSFSFVTATGTNSSIKAGGITILNSIAAFIPVALVASHVSHSGSTSGIGISLFFLFVILPLLLIYGFKTYTSVVNTRRLLAPDLYLFNLSIALTLFFFL